MKEKEFDWDQDRIFDTSYILKMVAELWEQQVFEEPTEDRKKKIIQLLGAAKEELENTIKEVKGEVK